MNYPKLMTDEARRLHAQPLEALTFVTANAEDEVRVSKEAQKVWICLTCATIIPKRVQDTSEYVNTHDAGSGCEGRYEVFVKLENQRE